MGTLRNVYVVYHVLTRDFVGAYSSELKAKDACARFNDYHLDFQKYSFKRLTVF